MRDVEKRNFIIMIEKMSSRVKMIVEGPDERRLDEDGFGQADRAIVQRAEELEREFPDDKVVIVRGRSRDQLKLSFPVFSGWENAHIE